MIDEERGPGRPATLTLPMVKQIAALMAKGMTEEQACTRMGVNHSTFRTARHRNPEFETAVKEAHAQFVDEALDYLSAGKRAWQGKAWILERRHGEQFRRNTGMEMTALVGPYSPAQRLAAKPLSRWIKEDFDSSVGAWQLLRTMNAEQLTVLSNAYSQVWGDIAKWTDEQLEWGMAVEQRIKIVERDLGLNFKALPAPEQ